MIVERIIFVVILTGPVTGLLSVLIYWYIGIANNNPHLQVCVAGPSWYNHI